MAYKPFLITAFETGLDTDVDPWLLPQDAFPILVNGQIHHKAIEKREGYVKQGDVVYQDQTNWTITAATQADPCQLTLTDVTGLSDNDVIEIRGVSGMTELNGNRYVLDNVTGGAGGTVELLGVDSSGFTAYTTGGNVLKVPGDRIMGLETYIDSGNVKELVAFTQYRASAWDATNSQFTPIDSADIMSGADTDYIQVANWASTASTAAAPLFRMYFTNGKALSGSLDGIRYYTGSNTTTSFAPSTGTATINGCKLLFAYRNRLVLLHTTEGAQAYPQRARWCKIGDPSGANAWDDTVQGRGGYVDAPTGEQIIGGEFLKEQLIVYFTNSVWMLVPNTDPALPFYWRKINAFRSCDAPRSVVGYDDYVVSAGIRGITATDGVKTQRIDDRITDFVGDEVDSEAFGKMYGRRSFDKERMWMLYPAKADDDAMNALILDEDSRAWSIYDISMNVLGYTGASDDKTLQDFEFLDLQSPSIADTTLQDYTDNKNAELLVGGDRSGTTWIMEQGAEDNAIAASVDILSITNADPAVVTAHTSEGYSDGDKIYIADVTGMTEVNNRWFIVANKSGNSFELQGEDASGYSAGTGGALYTSSGTDYDFQMKSAALNPWKAEGIKARMGYVDLLVDTNGRTQIDVSFYVDSNEDPYRTTRINLLPDLREITQVVGITNENPATVSAPDHGLSTGDVVYLYGVQGMEEINGEDHGVTVIDDDTFTIPVDSSNYSLYTNYGVVTRLPMEELKAWKRIYAGAVGSEHSIEIKSAGPNGSLRIHAIMPWFKPVGRRPQ